MATLAVLKKQWVLTALILALTAGCGFKIQKNPDGSPENNNNVAAPKPGVIMGYNSLKTAVFQPRCIQCHGNTLAKGHVNLETFATAKAVADDIRDEVIVQKEMPPTGPLADSEQKLIQQWIDAGTPEDDVKIPDSDNF